MTILQRLVKTVLKAASRKFSFGRRRGEESGALREESFSGNRNNRVSQLLKDCVISGPETDSRFSLGYESRWGSNAGQFKNRSRHSHAIRSKGLFSPSRITLNSLVAFQPQARWYRFLVTLIISRPAAIGGDPRARVLPYKSATKQLPGLSHPGDFET